jgi:hypothetical protein
MRAITSLIIITALGLVGVGCGGAPPSRYELFPMIVKYKGEQAGGGAYTHEVRYLNPAEAAQIKLRVVDGLLCDLKGAPLDAEVDKHPDRNGFAIYVMDGQGNIYYSFDHQQGSFHHSSLLAGADVAAAGDMTILSGRLVEISNSSGHYRPPPRSMPQVVSRLKELGVDFEGVEISVWGQKDRAPN